MKSFKYFIFGIIAYMFMSMNVLASDDSVMNITSLDELEKCLNTNGICKLTSDIVVDEALLVKGNVTLDLNGQTIAPQDTLKVSGGYIGIDHGAKLTINDASGKGIITTGAGNSNVWAAIQMAKGNTGNALSELVVNNGTIEGYYYGIVGNGNAHNTKITINNGGIKALNTNDSVGIYNPQMGDVIINNGTISGGTGIEMRAGNLTINDGTIKGIAPTFTKDVNTNGSTTNGAGISIAQHTTKNPINVTINNGNISGQYAFYEWNPHKNDQAALDKISIDINGGNFETLLSGGYAVYSEDFKEFINGGKFNTSVSEYLAPDAKLSAKVLDPENSLETENKGSNIWALSIIFIIIIGSIMGYIIYKKKTSMK